MYNPSHITLVYFFHKYQNDGLVMTMRLVQFVSAVWAVTKRPGNDGNHNGTFLRNNSVSLCGQAEPWPKPRVPCGYQVHFGACHFFHLCYKLWINVVQDNIVIFTTVR